MDSVDCECTWYAKQERKQVGLIQHLLDTVLQMYMAILMYSRADIEAIILYRLDPNYGDSTLIDEMPDEIGL